MLRIALVQAYDKSSDKYDKSSSREQNVLWEKFIIQFLLNSTYRITTSCRLFASVQSGISPVQIQLTNFQTHFSWNERLGQKDFILYPRFIFVESLFTWSTTLSAIPCMYTIIHAFQSINIFLSIRKVTYGFLEFF